MYKHILIATDGSELAQKGVEQGLALARDLGSVVTILTVTEPFPSYAMAGDTGWVASPADIERYTASRREFAERLLAKSKEEAKRVGVAADLLHLEDRFPAEGIVAAAKDNGCDLVVMASHGRRGLGRLLLGSQTIEVLTHSKVPVLVVR
ncbi:universal stress protein [Pseudaminobacter sp. NGMCC 1.201702]|uniref:universal stress protein n=1 Tax=Pseudaminobacter sp. NGMCC 1.201702 TaxID=3391825 RepID=UPI0039F06404